MQLNWVQIVILAFSNGIFYVFPLQLYLNNSYSAKTFLVSGKDNYPGEVFDHAFNETALDHNYRPPPPKKGEAPAPIRPKNVAFYHRYNG